MVLGYNTLIVTTIATTICYYTEELTNQLHALESRLRGGATRKLRMRTSSVELLPPAAMATNWLQTKSREELQRTLGWGDPPVVSSKEVFSPHHPMIPDRYVPAWQMDMENRRSIIKVGLLSCMGCRLCQK